MHSSTTPTCCCQRAGEDKINMTATTKTPKKTDSTCTITSEERPKIGDPTSRPIKGEESSTR